MTAGSPQSPSTALKGVSSLYMGRRNIQPALPTWSQDLDGCWFLPDGKVHIARALLLLGVSDLQTRAEEGQGDVHGIAISSQGTFLTRLVKYLPCLAYPTTS